MKRKTFLRKGFGFVTPEQFDRQIDDLIARYNVPDVQSNGGTYSAQVDRNLVSNQERGNARRAVLRDDNQEGIGLARASPTPASSFAETEKKSLTFSREFVDADEACSSLHFGASESTEVLPFRRVRAATPQHRSGEIVDEETGMRFRHRRSLFHMRAVSKMRTDVDATFQQICRACVGKIDFSYLPTARVDVIHNESMRSLSCQVEQALEEMKSKLFVSHDRPSKTAALISVTPENYHMEDLDFHSFVSSNAVREVLAGTSSNRFHVAGVAMKKFGSGKGGSAGRGEQQQKALEFQLRKGFYNSGFRFPGKTPVAITFSPLEADGSSSLLLGTTSDVFQRRKKVVPPLRLRCLLVGTLECPVVLERTLGHPPGTSLETVATVTSTALFKQERKKHLRAEEEKKSPKRSRLLRAIMAGAQLTSEDLAQRQEELDNRQHEASGNFLDELLGPSEGSKTNAPAAKHLLPPTLEQLLREKSQHDALPLRPVTTIPPDTRFPNFIPYRECSVRPEYLILFEVANTDPTQQRDLSDETLAATSKKISKLESSWTPLEYTTRWTVPIAMLQDHLRGDSWVKHWRSFPGEIQYNHELIALNELMSVLGKGAVSIDVNNEENVPQYRHSFTFTNTYEGLCKKS